MGFLSGGMTFECFRVVEPETHQFGPEQIELLEKFAAGRAEGGSTDQVRTGFLAGDHLLDRDFHLEKNVVCDALHFGVRVDTNQVPTAIRRAWLQIELAVLNADSTGRRPTKAMRKQAQEAVEARCEEVARSGQFQKLQQFPVLWDAREGLLYFGATSTSAWDLSSELLARAFELELRRRSPSNLVEEWAARAKRNRDLDDVAPSSFLEPGAVGDVVWWNQQSGNYDFLGNEFLLWLWWQFETQSDTIELPDGSEVTGMFARTLTLECPRGESGKGTISSEGPTQLPEAVQAIRSGKLPRKAGLTLVRHGEQYALTLQAESFAVGGARMQREQTADGRGALEQRIDSLRAMNETIELMFQTFCNVRVGRGWSSHLGAMADWLGARPRSRKNSA